VATEFRGTHVRHLELPDTGMQQTLVILLQSRAVPVCNELAFHEKVPLKFRQDYLGLRKLGLA
jgi:hypothetical protein